MQIGFVPGRGIVPNHTLSMLLRLYRLIFAPLLLLASPYYLLRMRRRGGYGEQFGDRFGAAAGLVTKRPGVKRIWLQAVSVGEILAVGPILEELGKDPALEVYLTTTTSTGFRLARERYGGQVAGVGYFPLDWWGFSARAWRRVEPDLVILTEGERWPEHLAQAHARGVPVVCINARLSDRSHRRMRALRMVVRPLFGGITRLLPASLQDEKRFREIGFPPERITTTGNIKLDVVIPVLGEAEKTALRAALGLGQGDLVVLGSSTWPGEESALLEALREWRAAGIACRLLLVPRHAERRGEIADLLAGANFSNHFRSQGPAPAMVDIAVGDTTGELRQLTQVADVVFVGKSLPPHREGQTPVEAAALGKPLVLGPELTNFREMVAELVAVGAARQVSGADDLGEVIGGLLSRPDERKTMAAAASSWHVRNQGAVARTLAIIRDEFAGRVK